MRVVAERMAVPRLVPAQYGSRSASFETLPLGTSELYAAVEAISEISDSLVVDLEYLGRESFMALFVVLRDGLALQEDLHDRIFTAIRKATSPKHVPNAIIVVPEVPRTLSGKKLEVPIKRLLLGESIDRVVNRDAVANPASLN